MSTEQKHILPANFCAQTSQRILNAIIVKLREDHLYNPTIVNSLQGVLPLIEKITHEGNKKCNWLSSHVLDQEKERLKKDLLDKEIYKARKDLFTRFFLMPLEKNISDGGSREAAPEKIPRAIIPVIKKAVDLFSPHAPIEKSKIISKKIVLLYPSSGKGSDADWRGIVNDWKTVYQATVSNLDRNGLVEWRAVQERWKADFRDGLKIIRLKAIGEIQQTNERIMEKLVSELINQDSRASNQAKLQEHIRDHLFKETKHEPDNSLIEKVCVNLISALSKAAPKLSLVSL